MKPKATEVSPRECEHRMECRDCGAIPEETAVPEFPPLSMRDMVLKIRDYCDMHGTKEFIEAYNEFLADKRGQESVLKTHPCLVPFNELPFEQQLKDYIFRAIVRAFKASDDDKRLSR